MASSIAQDQAHPCDPSRARKSSPRIFTPTTRSNEYLQQSKFPAIESLSNTTMTALAPLVLVRPSTIWSWYVHHHQAFGAARHRHISSQHHSQSKHRSEPFETYLHTALSSRILNQTIPTKRISLRRKMQKVHPYSCSENIFRASLRLPDGSMMIWLFGEAGTHPRALITP